MTNKVYKFDVPQKEVRDHVSTNRTLGIACFVLQTIWFLMTPGFAAMVPFLSIIFILVLTAKTEDVLRNVRVALNVGVEASSAYDERATKCNALQDDLRRSTNEARTLREQLHEIETANSVKTINSNLLRLTPATDEDERVLERTRDRDDSTDPKRERDFGLER